MSMQNLLNKYVLIDIFCVKKRVFYTISVIFPCNLFESNVKFSVIFQLSCPCNITAPGGRLFSRTVMMQNKFKAESKRILICDWSLRSTVSFE